MSCSGLQAFYIFKIDNSSLESFITEVKISTSRIYTSRNEVTLKIQDKYRRKDFLIPLTNYVNNKLQDTGARLRKFSDFKVVIPDHVTVDYKNARLVIDRLFQNNEMSATNRSEIENALRELETSAKFAAEGIDEINTAQKEIIESMVEPYVEDICKEAPDLETAKRWIQCVSIYMQAGGFEYCQKRIGNILYNRVGSGHGKSKEFYESLLAVGRIYASMGDLEKTLSQIGEKLPSNEMIKKTIEEFLDKKNSN
jgi:hypothetical protein